MSRGQWRDILVVRDGALPQECLRGKCTHTPEEHRMMVPVRAIERAAHNLIVENIGIAIASALMEECDLFHGMGAGDAGWDVSDPGPVDDQTTLEDEVFRKAVGSIDYVDQMPPGESVVAGPTRYIQFTTTVDFGEANGLSLREHGLFGANATIAFDSGAMMDAIHHPRIDKNNTFQIIRQITLGF